MSEYAHSMPLLVKWLKLHCPFIHPEPQHPPAKVALCPLGSPPFPFLNDPPSLTIGW